MPGFDLFVVKYSGVFQVVLYGAKIHWQDLHAFVDNGSKTFSVLQEQSERTMMRK